MSDQVRALWKAEPFRPFTMRLSDGRILTVRDRRSVHVSPGGGLVLYCDVGHDLKLIDSSLIKKVALWTGRAAGDEPIASASARDYSHSMVNELRKLWHAQPFMPFSIHLADGRELHVPHPDFFWMSSKGGQIFVEDHSSDNVHFLNPLVIVSASRVSDSAGQPA